MSLAERVAELLGDPPDGDPGYSAPAEDDNGDWFTTIHGAGGFVCRLGEPEDRNWCRDGAPVLERLNALHRLIRDLADALVKSEAACKAWRSEASKFRTDVIDIAASRADAVVRAERAEADVARLGVASGDLMAEMGRQEHHIEALRAEVARLTAPVEAEALVDAALLAAVVRAAGFTREAEDSLDDARTALVDHLRAVTARAELAARGVTIDAAATLAEDAEPPSPGDVDYMLGGGWSLTLTAPGRREAMISEAPEDVRSKAIAVLSPTAPIPTHDHNGDPNGPNCSCEPGKLDPECGHQADQDTRDADAIVRVLLPGFLPALRAAIDRARAVTARAEAADLEVAQLRIDKAAIAKFLDENPNALGTKLRATQAEIARLRGLVGEACDVVREIANEYLRGEDIDPDGDHASRFINTAERIRAALEKP